ncbi:MAG: type II toxin-antitoxin system RelB/DinJ family antitoxin [Clostridiales bacterium]|jgi:addiction module RelB/DinJ family antitoxin|nr:type II toxin-antitoxin system RelB/DinJ family antitoxin [Clostridiales bacterium]
MTTINIHTDAPLKNKVQAVFEGMGFDMSTAINLFFRHIAYGEALPFEAGRAKPESENPSKFIFGGWEGKIVMPDDFNEPMEEFEGYM